MGKIITVTAEIELPRIPAFLKYDGGTIDIAHISDRDLRAIASLWASELVRTAQARRANKTES